MLLAMTQFVLVIDASIVNVAMPSIGRALHFSQADLSWVVNAYTLTFGGFLLLGGRLADLMGRRRMFIGGLALFSLASFAGGIAQSEAWLIAARAAQGLGGAIVSPAALSIITTTFAEGAERNRALGVWGAVAGAGGAAGVLLGGVLTSYASWPWIFLINVPVGLAVIALAPRFLAETRRLDAVRHFDAAGALTVTAALMLFVYALTSASEHGWGNGLTPVWFAASAALLTLFVGIERQAKAPLMPLGIYRIRTLAAGNTVLVVLSSVAFSNFFLLALYLQQVLGYSAAQNGVAFVAVAATIAVVSNFAGPLVRRAGAQPVLALGVGLLVLSEGWLLRLPVHGHYGVDLLPAFVLMGLGMAFSFVAVIIAALAGVPAADAGVASGITNTARQIGGAIGLAVVTTVASAKSGASAATLTHDFHAAFVVLFALLLVALGVTLTLLGPSRADAPIEAEEVEEAVVLAEAA
jgi:EmrB/QacA subfamily drug resistance transporter